MSDPLDLRHELRAYTQANSCRLAAILLELSAKEGASIAWQAVAVRWAKLYPHHAAKHRITRCVTDALALLEVAGIAGWRGGHIVILNLDLLRMSAGNLAIIQDAEGKSLGPARWPRSPVVPEHLQPIQDELGARHLEAKALRDSTE